MELTQRIKQRLREVDDWNAVVEEHEAEAAGTSDKTTQSRVLYELARACEDIVLDKARAMTCYQQAFKCDQTNLPALRHARVIYQEMAHLEMVARFIPMSASAVATSLLEMSTVNRRPPRAPRLASGARIFTGGGGGWASGLGLYFGRGSEKYLFASRSIDSGLFIVIGLSSR